MRGRGDDGTTLCRHRRRFLGQDGQRLLQDIRSGLLVFSSRKGFLILSAGVAVPGSSKRARRLGQSAGASSRNPISVPWPLIAPTHHHHFFSVTSDFALCCTLKLILYAYLTAFSFPASTSPGCYLVLSPPYVKSHSWKEADIHYAERRTHLPGNKHHNHRFSRSQRLDSPYLTLHRWIRGSNLPSRAARSQLRQNQRTAAIDPQDHTPNLH